MCAIELDPFFVYQGERDKCAVVTGSSSLFGFNFGWFVKRPQGLQFGIYNPILFGNIFKNLWRFGPRSQTEEGAVQTWITARHSKASVERKGDHLRNLLGIG